MKQEKGNKPITGRARRHRKLTRIPTLLPPNNLLGTN